VVPDGKFVGAKIVLRPWQKKMIVGIYDTPTRRAIISVGRKNAKTALAAILLLMHLCGPEARANSQLYSTALSRDQAAIVYSLAAKMVRFSPELSSFVTVRETIKELACQELGTLYKALSADAATSYGLSPVFIVHDELGQVKGPRHSLYEALETATGAQEAPLSIVISTQAPNDADLLSILIDDAKGGHDPKTKLFLYTAPDDADPFCEETIRQANPAFGDFQNAEETLAMAEAARRMPAREAEYRNLILNQRVEAFSPFVTKGVWNESGDDPEFGGLVFAGLDLSETSDLTALILVTLKAGKFNVKCTFWLPEDGLEERSRQDRVPYDMWAKQGFLKTTPGKSIEYEYVANQIAELFNEYDVRKVAFDRYNMRYLRPWLLKSGLSESLIDDRFQDFGQGFVSMSPALRTLETALLNGNMRHGNHPVLTMCAANSVVQRDPAGNRKLDKQRSRGRIDGMVALAMACAVASEHQGQRPVYSVNLESILTDIRA
jgi:phage terminase large subunit-like protein